MCACDRDGLCPACAEREAAEWEPDPREQAEARAWEQRTLAAELERAYGVEYARP